MTGIKFTSEDLHDHDAIGAVIKNERGEILMQEHVKYGFWTIPVGKARSGQSAVECLKKELFEECGIIVDKYHELTVNEYDYHDGRDIKVIAHIFEIVQYSGKITNKEPHKHRQQIFLPVDKIAKIPFLSNSTVWYLETLGIRRPSRL